MKCKFLFIKNRGYTKGWSGKYRVTNLSFRKGDILVEDERWGNIYTAINMSARRKKNGSGFCTDIKPAIQQNFLLPLNIKALWFVVYVKLGQPHYGWYAKYFKNVRGY